MQADYRFLRAGKGTSRFARVVLSATPAEAWETQLEGLPEEQARRHGEPLRAGLALAIAEQDRQGGPPHRIVLHELVETYVDTLADAVECAVAMAAWKSFGHEEGELVFHFAEGRWRGSFPP